MRSVQHSHGRAAVVWNNQIKYFLGEDFFVITFDSLGRANLTDMQLEQLHCALSICGFFDSTGKFVDHSGDPSYGYTLKSNYIEDILSDIKL